MQTGFFHLHLKENALTLKKDYAASVLILPELKLVRLVVAFADLQSRRPIRFWEIFIIGRRN